MRQQQSQLIVEHQTERETLRKAFRSTTHEERFYHLKEQPLVSGKRLFKGGTVFFRKEHGTWFAEAARCDHRDHFNRPKGRNMARRRYFQKRQRGKHLLAVTAPSYEAALTVYRHGEQA